VTSNIEPLTPSEIQDFLRMESERSSLIDRSRHQSVVMAVSAGLSIGLCAITSGWLSVSALLGAVLMTLSALMHRFRQEVLRQTTAIRPLDLRALPASFTTELMEGAMLNGSVMKYIESIRAAGRSVFLFEDYDRCVRIFRRDEMASAIERSAKD
jgi:hypothetical protein